MLEVIEGYNQHVMEIQSKFENAQNIKLRLMNMNLYSATMLVNFINYNHFITDEFDEKIFNLKKSEKTIVDNLRI